ncbi:phage tail tape measure protein [Clostridium sp. UBA4395]|uniref:phage tail tape measure protein n=1 Tax=Clostridium sp. UBA4395 TaxID=1946360 RepID=UPI0032167904
MGEQLLVTIGAKDSASTVIKKVNSELKYLDKEYGLAKKSSKDFESSQDGLRTKLDYLGNKYEVNKTKLQAYKNQLDKAKESVAKKEEELEKLKNAEGDNAVAIEKAEKQLEKYKDQLDKANKNINLTEKEMGNLTKEIDSTSESLDNFKVEQFKARMEEVSQSVQDAGQKIKNVGQGMSNIGGGLMKLSAPILAGSVAIGKMNMDFEQGIANINTLLDDTTNLDSYKNKIKELSDDTGINVEIMTDGMYQAISSLGDAGKQTEGIFEVMAKSSKAGGAETSDSVSLISAAMKGYGDISEKSAQKVSDLAFVTAKLGVTTFPEMAKSMQPLFPLSSALNISMEDLFGSMATLTGVTGNTSEVSTQLKAIFSNLIKPTKAMAEVIKKYGYENSQAMIKSEGMAGVLEILQKETGGSADKMGALFSSTEALTAVTALCGANYKDFINKSGQMNNVLGATDTAMKKVSSTEKDKLTTSINRLKNSFLESGEKLTPLIDGLSNGIEDVANAIGKMNPEVVASIAKIGLFTFATGGALKGVGGLTQGIGSLVIGSGKAIGKFGEFAAKAKTMETVSSMASVGGVGKLGAAITGVGTATTGATGGVSILSTGLSALGGIALPLAATVAALGGAFYAAHEYNDLMNSSVLKSTDEMSAMEIILGSLTGATLHSKEEMEKMGYVYAEWNSDVSPETQKALDSIAEKSRNLQLAIDSVNFDGVITKEDITIVKTKTDEWCNSIIEVINNNKSEINSSIEGLFGADGIVTEQEQKVLDILNNSNDEKKKIVEESAAKIKEINERASKENREISRAEQAVIKGEIIKANKAVLDSMNISSEEKLAAQNLFFEKSNAHSARALSESIIQEKTARDEQIAIIKEKYDSGIQALKAKIEGMSGLEKEQAEAELQNQIEQRDLLIQNENEKWNGIIGACEEKYPQYMDKINKYTGEEMSFWDRRKNERFQKEIAKYDEINRITEDGTYRLLNTETKTWDNIVVKTDEATGEIIALNKLNVSERGIGRDSVVGYSKDICNQMDEEVRNAIKNRSIMTSIMNGYTKATVDSNGNILDSNNKVIGSLDRMTTATDGTRQGFIDINGTPVKIKTNADGTIKNLKEIKTAIDNIPLNKNVTLTVKEQRWRSSASDGIDRFYADGTNYAQPGVAFVAEEGQELIEKNGTFYLTGDDGPQLFNFSGGEKVYTAAQTRDILTSGSYYSADSLASRELINSTTNNYSTYNNSSMNTGGIDYSVMAQTVAQAVAQAIQNISLTGSVKLDDSSIVGKVSNSFAMAGRRAR